MALFECYRCGKRLVYQGQTHACTGGQRFSPAQEESHEVARQASRHGSKNPVMGKVDMKPKTSEMGTERPQPAGRQVRAPNSSQASQRGNVPDNNHALTGNRETRESPKPKRGRPRLPDGAPVSRATRYRRQKGK